MHCSHHATTNGGEGQPPRTPPGVRRDAAGRQAAVPLPHAAYGPSSRTTHPHTRPRHVHAGAACAHRSERQRSWGPCRRPRLDAPSQQLLLGAGGGGRDILAGGDLLTGAHLPAGLR